MKLSILFQSTIVALLVGCTTTTAIKSYRQTNANENCQISGVDEKSKIQWRIANDDKKLYFMFESSEKLIHRMLLGNGFTLLLDTTTKKNEAFSFTVSNRQKPGEGVPQSISPNEKQQQDRWKNNLQGSFKEALWKEGEGDSEQLIDLQFDKTDFLATYKIDSFELIVCNVTIPLLALKSNGINGLKNVSVCLKIEPGQRQHHNGEESFGDESHTGIEGEMGGGMRGGMGRGGMNGSMGGGMGRGGMGGRHVDGGMNSSSQSSSSVNFWFVTELAK